ncbi:MAG: hypothetical protein MJ220_02830 [Bacilli bacterium]|nr:hypothetical protein [Bacilli bacterium]
MSIYVNNVLRIKRNSLQQEEMKMLVDADLFAGYKDILMISAVIGYNARKYEPISKVATEGVLMSFFNEKDYDIIDLIAYSHKKEQMIVKSDEKYEIFSSYANAGFPILLEKLGIAGQTSLGEDEARKAQCKYYSLLLSGEFLPKIESLKDDELFI